MAKEKIIGIDLGTSNSAASALQAGKPVIIPSAEGTTAYGKAFPSVVAFTKDSQVLVGEPARRQAVSNPEKTIMAAKRKMGTNHKYVIDGKEYKVNYPECSGCEHLCFPWPPFTRLFLGNGCEYPEGRKSKETKPDTANDFPPEVDICPTCGTALGVKE